ncbi:MAG: phage portal protein [Clostridia bacterium]|nr:phage portal protein [Clostridia bacterium]
MILSRLPERVAEYRYDYAVDDRTRERLDLLVRTYNSCLRGNALKRRYYEGHVTLREVNLGLALPKDLAGLEIGCAWGAKTVDVLAARSMFDGYVGRNGDAAALMTRIAAGNNLVTEYSKATRNELIYGCDFVTLSADPALGCRISWHSPETAAALWNDEKGRIDCGLAVASVRRKPQQRALEPSVLAYYDEEATWILRRDDRDVWTGERYGHKLGRPLMVPLVFDPTSAKPFGRGRLKKPIRELIRGYVRTMANATIGLEFSTAPQKYLLGVTDKQYDAVIDKKFQTYVGSMILGTSGDNGEKPAFGQLPQGSLGPHVDMLRMLSTQFSAATGLTVTDVGVVNDANPTSSDAILAQSQTLIALAEQLNAGNGAALEEIALMAQAIARNVTPAELTEEELDVVAHFRNPAMPSVAVTADAAVKIAGAREGFAETDVFLEMLGFSPADIRRIKAQESRARGLEMLSQVITDEDLTS